jgi:AhpC/TSA family
VLPRGSFTQTRSAVETSLGTFRSELAVPLVITEDYEGGWTQAFNAAGSAATYLLGPDGEIAWKHQGQLDATSLAAALDQHAIAARRQRSRLLRTALRVGERIPDFLYGVGQGRQLRGRRLLLLFWKSCSTPCINELVRLQHMHRRTGGRGSVILAVADGEDAQRIAEVIRQNGLGFLVVPDPNRQIARPCGINCWPTIVAVREDGLVSAIHYGATHPPRAPVSAVVAE